MRKNSGISNEAPGLSTKRTGSSIDCAAFLPSPFLARMNKPDRSQNRPSSRYISPCQALAGSSSPRCSRRRSKPCSGADYPILRILCGVAPVTRQSGKSRTAQPINGLAAATKVIRHERMLFARGETNGPLKKVTHKAHNL
jgi:hypothetical protein